MKKKNTKNRIVTVKRTRLGGADNHLLEIWREDGSKSHTPTPTQPDIWLQGDESNGRADCGCKLVADYKNSGDPAFFFCLLHRRAVNSHEASLEALYAVWEDIKSPYFTDRHGLREIVRSAIANAEGK